MKRNIKLLLRNVSYKDVLSIVNEQLEEYISKQVQLSFSESGRKKSSPIQMRQFE